MVSAAAAVVVTNLARGCKKPRIALI